MKKKQVLVFAICIILGIGLVVQSKISDGEKLYASSDTIDDYKANIQGEKDAIKEIKDSIEETRKVAEEYRRQETVAGREAKVTAKLEEEITSAEMLNGNVAVTGRGVVITMDDGDKKLKKSQDVNDVLVHEGDILRIINDLKLCGAEAISVNGQRITDTTAINCSGYTIRINGKTYARPYVIKAVGNSKKMISTLLAVSGYGTALQNYGVKFKIRSAAKVHIAKYKGNREIKYMQEAEGDDKK